MKHVGSIALALGLLPFSAVGVAQDFAKAKQEGRVVFYTSWGPSDADYVIKGFERKYPFLKVDPVRSSSERTLNRLLTEQRANSFLGDVVAISGIQSGILKEKGAPDPLDGGDPNKIALLKNTPRPNAAKIFIDFMLSVEGQKLLQDKGRSPGRIGLSPKNSRLKEAKIFTFHVSPSEYEALGKEFNKIFKVQ